MVERGKGLTTYVVPNAKIKPLFPSIEKYVAIGSTISTDEAQGDRTHYKIGYGHDSMNHRREEWVKGKTRTQRIEGFWPHIKCSLRGTHRSISTQRMQKYLVEFESPLQSPSRFFFGNVCSTDSGVLAILPIRFASCSASPSDACSLAKPSNGFLLQASGRRRYLPPDILTQRLARNVRFGWGLFVVVFTDTR